MDVLWTDGPYLIRWRNGSFSCREKEVEELLRAVLAGKHAAPLEAFSAAPLSFLKPGSKTAPEAAAAVYWATSGGAVIKEGSQAFKDWYRTQAEPYFYKDSSRSLEAVEALVARRRAEKPSPA